jgi:hypothetical protein
MQRLANRISGNASADASELRANVTRYSRKLAYVAATNGPAFVNVTLNGTASEKRLQLVQTTAGNFKDRDNDNDWTLVDDGNVTSFSMVLASNLPNSYPVPYTLSVTNGTDQWDLSAWKDNSGPTPTIQVQLSSTNPASTTTHEFDASGDVRVNESHIAGQSKTVAYDFARGVDPDYQVSVTDGQKADGTYRFSVNGSVVESNFYDESSNNEPYLDKHLTDAWFDLTYGTASVSYNTTIAVDVGGDPTPYAGVTLLYSHFEDTGGSLGANWTLTNTDGGSAGTAGVDTRAAHTGAAAAYHNGDGRGQLATATTYDTSAFEAVAVTFWAMEGYPTPSPPSDHGPEPGEGESLTLEYWSGSSWVSVDTVPADETATVSYERTVRIDDPAALHENFRIRFDAPADATTDHWYLDDVTIVGVTDP